MGHSGSYEQTTRQITVSVEPFYLDDQSEPDENIYIWAYLVRIENNGDETVRIRSRHWNIIDASGASREVQGEGIVGEQPVLMPGEAFEYISGAHLPQPSGIMDGYFEMELGSGKPIKIDIPAFSLDSPQETGTIH